MKRIVYGVLLCVMSFAVNSATFNVISGTFDVDTGTGTLGTIQLTGNGSFTEGTYSGNAAGISTDSNATFLGFETSAFLGQPLEFYFSLSGTMDDPGPFAPPTIDFNTMTADMNSVVANWNSSPGFIQEFNVGGIASVVALGANTWQLNWSHLQSGGPYLGTTTEMSMIVSTVPVPAAVWLFGSGLVAFVGFARRKTMA